RVMRRVQKKQSQASHAAAHPPLGLRADQAWGEIPRISCRILASARKVSSGLVPGGEWQSYAEGGTAVGCRVDVEAAAELCGPFAHRDQSDPGASVFWQAATVVANLEANGPVDRDEHRRVARVRVSDDVCERLL